jgi:pyrimidine operon attenuation protein/uracil phosphoribosyltransferase
MKNIKQLLNEIEIGITIERLCHQLIETHDDFKDTIIVGVQPRGAFLNQRILDKLKCHARINDVQSGNIDISFYRDDLRRRSEPIVPDIMDMHLTVEDKKVVLIDDVLYTGRSIRSAIDALMTFGRPKSVELLTLINRRFSRHFPIQPNYIGRTIDILDSERVIVEWKEVKGRDRVLIGDSTYE